MQVNRKGDDKSRGKAMAHTQYKWLMMALSMDVEGPNTELESRNIKMGT